MVTAPGVSPARVGPGGCVEVPLPTPELCRAECKTKPPKHQGIPQETHNPTAYDNPAHRNGERGTLSTQPSARQISFVRLVVALVVVGVACRPDAAEGEEDEPGEGTPEDPALTQRPPHATNDVTDMRDDEGGLPDGVTVESRDPGVDVGVGVPLGHDRASACSVGPELDDAVGLDAVVLDGIP